MQKAMPRPEDGPGIENQAGAEAGRREEGPKRRGAKADVQRPGKGSPGEGSPGEGRPPAREGDRSRLQGPGRRTKRGRIRGRGRGRGRRKKKIFFSKKKMKMAHFCALLRTGSSPTRPRRPLCGLPRRTAPSAAS